jgi:hypothetical protein
VHTSPASFRDWDGRVVSSNGHVYRVLSAQGLTDWQALEPSSIHRQAVEEGTMVRTEVVDSPPFDPAMIMGDRAAAVLRHERISTITYPYEWCFSMLKDAALLQLDLTARALDEGLMVKDATPYNVQWRGTNPVFIDTGSFRSLRPGEPWPAYRQFCMLFLNPLLLQAHRDLDIQRMLRGALDGVTPGEAAAILRGRDRLRKGVLTDVVLHARLEKKYADVDRAKIDAEVARKSRRLKPEILKANVNRLAKVVRGLKWGPQKSEWSDYRTTNTYADDDNARKVDFVRRAVSARPCRLVWDIGANDGAYSRIAAESAETVLALDIDHLTVERLYRQLRDGQGPGNILPMVFDFADPSPGIGWRNLERSPIEDRLPPDYVLALAVVHHICIGRNVPVAEFVDWLHSLACPVVVEFPDRDDSMAQRLLSAKDEGAAPDYTTENFDSLLRSRFEIVSEERLPSGTRVLYEVRPR